MSLEISKFPLLEGASVKGPERSEAIEAGRGQILSVTLLCLILS